MWSAFWQLEQGRQAAFESPQPFTYAEIDAWCRLTRQDLAAWEVSAIMEMDIARRGALLDAAAARVQPTGPDDMVHRRTVSFRDTRAVENLFDTFGTVVDC